MAALRRPPLPLPLRRPPADPASRGEARLKPPCPGVGHDAASPSPAPPRTASPSPKTPCGPSLSGLVALRRLRDTSHAPATPSVPSLSGFPQQGAALAPAAVAGMAWPQLLPPPRPPWPLPPPRPFPLQPPNSSLDLMAAQLRVGGSSSASPAPSSEVQQAPPASMVAGGDTLQLVHSQAGGGLF
ncbi:vegetative cell wall protein gp1-like [Miscanthus floridulus]|uniref:vegetative cell wall protein gp1-like n=1 Tax=Miscanthus floridulus TaxID=154761 RepID=UPI00345862C9